MEVVAHSEVKAGNGKPRSACLEGSIDEVKIQMEYDGGLSGGKYRESLALDLSVPTPMLRKVTTARDIIATEQVQPQLAMFFPGNTVLGYFNRNETRSAPLVPSPRFVCL